jgi:NAD(P)-dependent dehydrogenase (short-subunit alcohol dehydrogenase family)
MQTTGIIASAGAPLCSSAKHSIVALMRALKNDLAKLNISVSVVVPGITKTPILSQERKDLQPPEYRRIGGGDAQAWCPYQQGRDDCVSGGPI